MSDWKNRTIIVFKQEVPLPFFLAVVFSFLLLFPLRHVFTYGKWQEYESERYGFSIEYPAAWPFYPHGDSGYKGNKYLRVRFNDTNWFTSSMVLIHETPNEENLPLTEMANWWKIHFGTPAEYNWSELEEVSIGIGDYPAIKQTYLRGESDPIKAEVYYLVFEENSFALEFVLDEEYKDTRMIFDRMLDSLELFEATYQ